MVCSSEMCKVLFRAPDRASWTLTKLLPTCSICWQKGPGTRGNGFFVSYLICSFLYYLSCPDGNAYNTTRKYRFERQSFIPTVFVLSMPLCCLKLDYWTAQMYMSVTLRLATQNLTLQCWVVGACRNLNASFLQDTLKVTQELFAAFTGQQL